MLRLSHVGGGQLLGCQRHAMVELLAGDGVLAKGVIMLDDWPVLGLIAIVAGIGSRLLFASRMERLGSKIDKLSEKLDGEPKR